MTTPQRFQPALLSRARSVKVFFMDVDGVLTDGSLFVGSEGEIFKRFHTLDGHGLKMLQAAGVKPVVITGRDSLALRKRLHELGLHTAYFGVEDKRAVAQSCLDELGLNWSHTAAIGDDWPDLPMLLPAALSMAPPQAHAEVLSRVHHVCSAAAGAGAVREACDVLLQALGAYDRFLKAVAP
ncbi:MAG: 3-deoxy-D-manno-octulosonate 8-phosphate phosphatase KdsC [Pseudomonadota bacterium]|jgi:3-deoxy-D-manno-octulosonate 8-phosphate phosphatase (KDO 8-P phosphatase)